VSEESFQACRPRTSRKRFTLGVAQVLVEPDVTHLVQESSARDRVDERGADIDLALPREAQCAATP
jgi:hypothetical protein